MEIYNEPTELPSDLTQSEEEGELTLESLNTRLQGYHHFKAWIRAHRFGGFRRYVSDGRMNGAHGEIQEAMEREGMPAIILVCEEPHEFGGATEIKRRDYPEDGC